MFVPERKRPHYRVKQAAPANYPARCITRGFRFVYTADHRAASRWVIRGSRLSQHFAARWSAKTKIARVARYAPKAAPLQALGDITSRERTSSLEDEDDYDTRDLTDPTNATQPSRIDLISSGQTPLQILETGTGE